MPRLTLPRLTLSRLALPAALALLLLTAAVVGLALAPTAPPAPVVGLAAAIPSPPPKAVSDHRATPSSETPAARPYDAAARALDLRIDGLTLAEALDGVARYARGNLPEHSRWLYRVSGFLHRHPAHCAALADAALADGATGEMQAMAADVLAGVGHGAAQAALRDLIDRSALGPAVRHRLLQSHLNLRTPSPEAADWLARQLDDPQVGPAAANALGAVAGRLAETHPAQADAALSRLQQGLKRAQTVEGQRAHLLGLGNSGQAAAHVALPFAESETPAVRAAAARALRHLPDAEARQALLRLAVDPDDRVRARAIEALLPNLSADNLDPLMAALRDGALGASAEGSLLAAALHPEQPHRRALLDGLVAGAAEPRIRERARVALLAR